ncbi:MAG: M48 family metallopeptidase [Bacteroidales bacterium]|nr:M48 family metallopeptidase [Bacteroidota bacterium]MBL6949419.1 M48 family metallopeptidase [Bacteroidales bacterium]
MTFFYLILAILIVDFLLERVLEYLNTIRWSDALPDELKGIYDEDRYRKSQLYLKEKQHFSWVTDSVTFVAMVAILCLGGFVWLDDLLRRISENPILLALLFFGIIGFISSLVMTPFELYGTFVIEEKFGFNTTTIKTFILDKLKGWLLGVLIGGGILALIIWIYTTTGNYFWLIVWGVITLFMIFMSMFYSNLIVPLFNKQKPLDSGELRDAIESFANKVGFRLKNIYVIDGSKRSTKANAYFTGLGGKKRIVLYDTLIRDHTTEELVGVLAHEIGHYKKKHTLQGIILSILQTGLMLFILSLFIRKDSALSDLLCQALSGFSGLHAIPGFYLGILAFGLLYSPLSFILGILESMLSRTNEYAADRFAGINYNPVSLQNALKKLSVNQLSNLRPHPLYVFFHYSHPPLLSRLRALAEIN